MFLAAISSSFRVVVTDFGSFVSKRSSMTLRSDSWTKAASLPRRLQSKFYEFVNAKVRFEGHLHLRCSKQNCHSSIHDVSCLAWSVVCASCFSLQSVYAGRLAQALLCKLHVLRVREEVQWWQACHLRRERTAHDGSGDSPGAMQ